MKKTAGEPALIKPKMSDDLSNVEAKSKEASPQPTEIATKVDSKPSTAASDTSLIKPKLDPRTEKSAPGTEPKKPGDPVATAEGKKSAVDPALTEQAKDVMKVPADVDLSKAGESFKKHDHSKYTEKITKSAKDLVHKDSTCKFAQLCRNTTTDQWDLNLYYFHGKTWVLTAYAWDEIDEKWKEAFTSDKQPVSRWKTHLEVSSAGKQCSTMKGTVP